MKTYEVIIRKIVTAAYVVEAENEEDAKYRASCAASDNYCEEVLGADAIFELILGGGKRKKPKRYAVAPNFRFWQYVHNGWVRLTLRPGQTRTWGYSKSHDEGWSSLLERWTLDYDGVTCWLSSASDGCDCDGRLARTWEGIFNRRTGSYVPAYDGQRLHRPKFQQVRSGQRDYAAEALNY